MTKKALGMELAPWPFSENCSDLTGRSASTQSTRSNIPTSTRLLCRPNPAISLSWRKATNTTAGSSTIERQLYLRRLKGARLDVGRSRVLAVRTQVSTVVMASADETA